MNTQIEGSGYTIQALKVQIESIRELKVRESKKTKIEELKQEPQRQASPTEHKRWKQRQASPTEHKRWKREPQTLKTRYKI